MNNCKIKSGKCIELNSKQRIYFSNKGGGDVCWDEPIAYRW